MTCNFSGSDRLGGQISEQKDAGTLDKVKMLKKAFGKIADTVLFLNFQTDRSEKTEEQSDQGLHCLPFRLHCLDTLPYGKPIRVKF